MVSQSMSARQGRCTRPLVPPAHSTHTTAAPSGAKTPDRSEQHFGSARGFTIPHQRTNELAHPHIRQCLSLCINSVTERSSRTQSWRCHSGHQRCPPADPRILRLTASEHADLTQESYLIVEEPLFDDLTVLPTSDRAKLELERLVRRTMDLSVKSLDGTCHAACPSCNRACPIAGGEHYLVWIVA